MEFETTDGKTAEAQLYALRECMPEGNTPALLQPAAGDGKDLTGSGGHTCILCGAFPGRTKRRHRDGEKVGGIYPSGTDHLPEAEQEKEGSADRYPAADPFVFFGEDGGERCRLFHDAADGKLGQSQSGDADPVFLRFLRRGIYTSSVGLPAYRDVFSSAAGAADTAS